MPTFKEVAELQTEYARLLNEGKLSKRAMCELCIPFRNKYGLTDGQTLAIAREELNAAAIVEIFEKKEKEAI